MEQLIEFVSKFGLLILFVVLPLIQRAREKSHQSRQAGAGGRSPLASAPDAERAERKRKQQEARDAASEAWRVLLGGEPAEPAPAPREPAPEAEPAVWAELEQLEPDSVLEHSSFEDSLMPRPVTHVAPDAEAELAPARDIQLAEQLGSGIAERGLDRTLVAGGRSVRRRSAARTRRAHGELLAGLTEPAAWRRAVVLSEVLGSPRALQAFGDGPGSAPGLR